MHSYKAAFDHVPVSWLVALYNISCGAYNIIEYGVERVWSFGSAICNNLVGFDKYFVFLNNSCVPIPYNFYGGARGDGNWLYDARNRVFQYCGGDSAMKRQVLPWLTMDLECTISGERREYELSGWMESVTFFGPSGFFPHPLQILAAWSLHSRIWPSLMRDANTQLKIIRAHDGEDMSLHMYKDFSNFAWCETTFSDEEEYDSEEPEGSEEAPEESSEEENTEVAETGSMSLSSSEGDIIRSNIQEESKESEESRHSLRSEPELCSSEDERPTLPLSDDSSSETSTNSLDVINEPDYGVCNMDEVD